MFSGYRDTLHRRITGFPENRLQGDGEVPLAELLGEPIRLDRNTVSDATVIVTTGATREEWNVPSPGELFDVLRRELGIELGDAPNAAEPPGPHFA